MIRVWSTILGVGLTFLWIIGISTPAGGWPVWLLAIAALCALLIAFTEKSAATRRIRAAGPVLLSAGLFVLFAAELRAGSALWISWWTFAFALAFLTLGIVAAVKRPRPMIRSPGEIESLRPRKSA
jgi:hypothetical protein